ncbi:MAG: hypothetical protein FJX75_01050 [Armatimonadetes bacterium]|nr:hypothetical protein [Armatimonadota bacterium]
MPVGFARLQGTWEQLCGRLADERHRVAAGCLWAAAVVGLAFAIYGPRLYSRPDGFDESVYIRQLGPLNWDDLGRWCTSAGTSYPCFRPLGFLSLFIDRALWDRPHVRYGADGSLDTEDLERQAHDPTVAFPYRLTNLFVFAASCVAFGLMLGRLGCSRALGAVAGLIYAAAPENRITVLYYPERFILLVALCGYLSAYLFLGWVADPAAPRRRAVLSVALLAPALLAKEHALVLPALLVAWMVLTRPRSEWRRSIWPLLGMCVVVALYLAWRFEVRGFFFNQDMAAMIHRPRFWYLPVRFMLVTPWTATWGLPSMPPSGWVVLTPSFWDALLHAGAFWGSAYVLVRGQWRLVACFVAWMAIMYAPIAHAYTYDLFPYKLYLPGAGAPAIAALAVWEWSRAVTRWQRPYRLVFVVLMAYVTYEWLRG